MAAETPGLKRELSHKRATFDESGQEIVKPGCFTRGVMKCPCVILWVTFLVALILSALPIVSGRVKVTFSGSAGTDTNQVEEIEDFWTWRTLSESDDKFEVAASGSVMDDDGQNHNLYFYYEGLTNKNMFTAEAIAAMDAYERAVLELPARLQ